MAIKKKQNTVKKEVQEVNKGQQVVRGRVVAAKLPKTVTVLVESRKTHPLYGKSYKVSKKYLVQDDLGVTEGDLVEMVKVKPISKNKHFAVRKVVGRDIEAIVTKELKAEAAENIAEVMPEKSEDQIKSDEIRKSEDEKIGEPEKEETKKKTTKKGKK